MEITVVTVCYNVIEAGRREMFLQCLTSVQAQHGVSLEHLIVDGASTDGTLELAQDFVAETHPVRIISEPDKGIYDAMNKGLNQAKGKYIIYLNTDDYYHNPNGLKASLERIKQTGCDFSFAPIYVLWEKKKKNPHVNPSSRIFKFFFHSVLSHQSILASTQTLRELGGFDLSFRSAADYDLELRLIMGGYKGCFVPLEFVSYRMIGQSSVNVDLSREESARSLQQNYQRFLSVAMSQEEAMFMHCRHRLPRRFGALFPTLVGMTDKCFVGIERSALETLSYNYKLFTSYIINKFF